MTAVKLISVLKPVIDRPRRLALIIDDTLMARSCSKKTELLAKVYDHDKHEFLTGYLKQLGLDSVGMFKQTKKVYYRYRDHLFRLVFLPLFYI